MPNCVNLHCRRPLPDEYYFCPTCGTDNRAPEQRVRLADHVHKYPEIGSFYCIWCGEPKGEPYAIKYRWRLRIGWTLSLVGFAGLVFGITCIAISALPKQPTPEGFVGWCQMEKLEWSRKYQRYNHTTNGVSTGSIAAALGFLSGVYGVRMLFRMPLTRNSGNLWDPD